MFRDRAAQGAYEIMDKAFCTLGAYEGYPYPSVELGITIACAMTRLGAPGTDHTIATAILEFDALEGTIEFDDGHREELWKDLLDAAEKIDLHCKYLAKERDAILETPEEADPDA